MVTPARFQRSTPGLATLLAASALGVYLLVILGATTTLSEAAAACSTWPACHGRWLPTTGDAQLLVAWAHRVAALLVGLLVAATAATAWRRPTASRVRAAVTLPAFAYPVQIAIGALTATTTIPAVLSAAHLVLGMGIFASVVIALAWTLEAETGVEDETTNGSAAEETADGTPAEPALERDPVADDGPESTAGRSAESAGDDGVEPTTIRRQSEGAIGTVRRTVSAYGRLMKPRLMWLLCLVASAGMALAAGPSLEVDTVVATLFGGVLAIGASGTFNHVLERDVDQRMSRTSDRPLATEVVPVRNAVAFGLLLTVAAVAVFLTLNLLAAALGLAAILFYSVVYTLLLKPNTVQNTVIGGAAGALPALIGWAAVTNEIGLPALALAGVIFLWTPAHFYNLALAYKQDYERGGFPMLPVVRGEAVTRKHILYYLGATLVAASALSAIADLGWLYAATTVVLGGTFLVAVVHLHRERTRSAAFRAFHASNAYLGCLLLAIVAERLAL